MGVKTNDGKVYTTAQIGRRRHMTDDGYLICEQVPLARTGELLYRAGELGLDMKADDSGIIRVTRDAATLFDPVTIASFEGKPFTLDHPGSFVSPSNWRELTSGIALNVRRGDGSLPDFSGDTLYSDLMVTDPTAITRINAEDSTQLREISLGYEADYDQDLPGRGVQRNIIGNHIALVKTGRNGPRIAIGDSKMPAKKPTWLEKLKNAIRTNDADAEAEALAEAEETADAAGDEDEFKKETRDALAAMGAQLALLGGGPGAMPATTHVPGSAGVLAANPGLKIDGVQAPTMTADALTVIGSRAEILAPGLGVITFDAAQVDAAAAALVIQRRALNIAFATPAGQAAITPFLNGGLPTFDAMPAERLDAVFTGAAELMRAQNNAAAVKSIYPTMTRDTSGASVIEQMNADNRKFWSANRGAK